MVTSREPGRDLGGEVFQRTEQVQGPQSRHESVCWKKSRKARVAERYVGEATAEDSSPG